MKVWAIIKALVFYLSVDLPARLYLIYSSIKYFTGFALWLEGAEDPDHMLPVSFAAIFTTFVGLVVAVRLPVATWKISDLGRKRINWTATIPLCVIGIASQLYMIAERIYSSSLKEIMGSVDMFNSNLLFIGALLVMVAEAIRHKPDLDF